MSFDDDHTHTDHSGADSAHTDSTNTDSTHTDRTQNKPPKANPRPGRAVPLGAEVRAALHEQLRLRKDLRWAKGVSMHQRIRFDRRFWLSTKMHQALKILLEEQLLHYADRPCRKVFCYLQQRANLVFNTSYRYLRAVLLLLKSPQATALRIKETPCDRFGVRRHVSPQGFYCYLHLDELMDLIEIINERIEEALYDEHANYPDAQERVDELPAVFYTLRDQGYTALSDLSTLRVAKSHTEARYWTDRHPFYLPILVMHSDGDTAFLSDRHSHRPWYCGTCLSLRIKAYCRSHQANTEARRYRH